MSDLDRPWFPCEEESFGPDIFPSLPAVREILVAQIAEISVLLRNYPLRRRPLSLYAVAENIVAMGLIQIDASTNLLATVAYGSRDARRFIHELGMPAIYAPSIAVSRNNLPPHWSSGTNIPDRFWPTVFLTEDVRQGSQHIRDLESVLELPTDELGPAFVRFCQLSEKIAPQAAMPAQGECDTLWISTPELDPA